MLELCGNAEVFEDHRDHEHIVSAQRHFDDVAGEELHRGETSVVDDAVDPIDMLTEAKPVMLVREVHEHVEQRRHDDYGDGERERFLHGHDVGFAIQYAQVECEHEQDEEEKPSPNPDHRVDRPPPAVRVGGLTCGLCTPLTTGTRDVLRIQRLYTFGRRGPAFNCVLKRCFGFFEL